MLDTISGAARGRLNAFENTLILAVCDAYPNPVGATVKEQLKRRFVVDRSNERLRTIYFKDDRDMPLVDDEEYRDSLFSVKFLHDESRHTGKVEIYRGKVFSVQCKKPHKVFASGAVNVVSVSKDKSKAPIDQVIDRFEHGRYTT